MAQTLTTRLADLLADVDAQLEQYATTRFDDDAANVAYARLPGVYYIQAHRQQPGRKKPEAADAND